MKDFVHLKNGNKALIMEELSNDKFLVSVKYKRDDYEWWPGDNLEIMNKDMIYSYINKKIK